MLTTVVLIVAILAGLYMAWNIGANDVANAFGTSVGSGALTLRRAIFLAAIFEFLGAISVGGAVAQTIRKEIVDADALRASTYARAAAATGQAPASQPASAAAEIRPAAPPPRTLEGDPLRRKLVVGMLAALIGASIWLNVATYFGQPVSTTHAIIGAVIGFVVLDAGPGCIRWGRTSQIAASWVISPLVGGGAAFLLYRLVQRVILRSRHPVYMAKRAVPICFALVSFVISFSFVALLDLPWLAGLRAGSRLPIAFVTAALLSVCFGWLARFVLQKRTAGARYRLRDRYQVVEKWFSRIQPVNACYMSFAHGANDVANAIGPLAAVIYLTLGGDIDSKAPVPFWLLAMGGVGIVIGLATYGYKVIQNVGKNITEITPTRGVGAEFATGSTVLICSIMGLPISTSFVLVGAVMGVGLARGFGAIDLRVIRRIFASWIITIPASALLACAFYWVAMRLVG